MIACGNGVVEKVIFDSLRPAGCGSHFSFLYQTAKTIQEKTSLSQITPALLTEGSILQGLKERNTIKTTASEFDLGPFP